jgi:type IV pilus assembly protein PilA
MLKALKKRLKDQRGLTLIELLAVVVILGIIAAIAVPSIGGLIDNTKKDAHVANAQQMISSAKLAIADDKTLQTGTKYLTLADLESKGFIDTVKDPDGSTTSYVRTVITTMSDTAATSFVKIESGKVTEVKLINASRGVQVSADKGSVEVTALSRDSVN